MLAAGGVADIYVKALLLKVAFFLRDVCRRERQVRLRLVACHENDAFRFGLGAGCCGEDEECCKS